MGILKTSVVLLGIAVLLPSPPDDSRRATADAVYVEAATRTFTDLAVFCNHQPGACKTAGQIARDLEAKAKYGIQLVSQTSPPKNG
jgi:exo-beta-1,3-glucanase (GH17 family)